MIQVPMPDLNNEKLRGNHAVILVGYDGERNVFKLQNSWGSDWGDHGYFTLPYDYVLGNEHIQCLAGDLWTFRCSE